MLLPTWQYPHPPGKHSLSRPDYFETRLFQLALMLRTTERVSDTVVTKDCKKEHRHQGSQERPSSYSVSNDHSPPASMSSYSKDRTLRDAEASIPLNVGDSAACDSYQAELLADDWGIGNASGIGRGEGYVEWRRHRGQVGYHRLSPMIEPGY